MVKSIVIKALWQIPAILLITVCVALGFNQIRNSRMPLVCQWSEPRPAAKSSAPSGSISIISIEEAALLFKNNKAVFLDARPVSFYKAGHIKGALSLPCQEAEEKCVDVVEKIPSDMTIITYCDGAHCDLCENWRFFCAIWGLNMPGR